MKTGFGDCCVISFGNLCKNKFLFCKFLLKSIPCLEPPNFFSNYLEIYFSGKTFMALVLIKSYILNPNSVILVVKNLQYFSTHRL